MYTVDITYDEKTFLSFHENIQLNLYDTIKLQLSMFDPTSTKISFMGESLQLIA